MRETPKAVFTITITTTIITSNEPHLRPRGSGRRFRAHQLGRIMESRYRIIDHFLRAAKNAGFFRRSMIHDKSGASWISRVFYSYVQFLLFFQFKFSN